MRSIRIAHSLRTAVAVILFTLFLGGAGALLWLNHRGLPDSWRAQILKGFEEKGIFISVDSLRLDVLRGIVAGGVNVYSDASRARQVASLQELIIGLDLSKTSLSEVRVEKLQLRGGSLRLPVDPTVPDSRFLEIENVNAVLLMPGGRRLELREARGTVHGIRVELDAYLLGYRKRLFQVGSPEDQAGQVQRRQFLDDFLKFMEPWQFSEAEPPVIQVRVEGDLDDSTSVRAVVQAYAKNLQRRSIHLSEVSAKGEIRGKLIALENLEIRDERGRLSGRLEYDMAKREGIFDARSSLDLLKMARSHLSDSMKTLSFSSPPELNLHGNMAFPEGKDRQISLVGQINAKGLRFGKHRANQVKADFSWDGTKTFVDNIEIKHPEGTLTGRFFTDPTILRYELTTDLPPYLAVDFFKGQPLYDVLSDFTCSRNHRNRVHLWGSSDPNDPYAWTCKGVAEGYEMAYRGVPFHFGRVHLDLNHNYLDFNDGEVELDFSDYPLRKAHGGASTGHATVKQVRWDSIAKAVIVKDMQGTVWPAQVVRTFAKDLADDLEVFGFHQPPDVKASGRIGLFNRHEQSDLHVDVEANSPMDYVFAGKQLAPENVRINVRVLDKHTEANNIKFNLFEGLVRGNLDIRYHQGEQTIIGDLDWTRMRLQSLSTAYGFDKAAQGYVSGRLAFDQLGNKTSSLNGEGHLLLEDGQLFSVPIFGPLSPVLSALLGSRKVGFQQAQDAFCTFKIREGILNSDDFYTSTQSMSFTGEATVDLNQLTMEMIMRMNARGLFSIITLPLKPLYGLFQFRGVGPLKEPKWDNVMFTSPPKRQEEKLMEIPKATSVQASD
jgi:AsmA-like C-terminal region